MARIMIALLQTAVGEAVVTQATTSCQAGTEQPPLRYSQLRDQLEYGRTGRLPRFVRTALETVQSASFDLSFHLVGCTAWSFVSEQGSRGAFNLLGLRPPAKQGSTATPAGSLDSFDPVSTWELGFVLSRHGIRREQFACNNSKGYKGLG